MGIIDSVGDWVETTTANIADSLEREWTQEVRIEDTRDWLLSNQFVMNPGTDKAEVQGPKPTVETVLQVLVDAYRKNDKEFDQLAANAVKYNLAPADFNRDKVEAMASLVVQAGEDPQPQADTPVTTDGTDTTPSTPTTAGTSWRSGAKTTSTAATSPTMMFSEQDIRNLMVQSNIQDIQQLIDVANTAKADQTVFDMPDIPVPTNAAPTPSQAKYMEEYGQRELNRSLTPQQAVRYITDGNLSPSELINLQNRMIRAGYLDNTPEAMVPGDIMDPVTNQVWRNVLADSVRKNLDPYSLMTQMEANRAKAAVDLSTPQMRDVLNNVARQLMGRPLATTEMDGLVGYLSNIQMNQGAGTAANDLGQNVSTPDVADYLYQEVPNEIGVVGDALSQKSGTILKGFFA